MFFLIWGNWKGWTADLFKQSLLVSKPSLNSCRKKLRLHYNAQFASVLHPSNLHKPYQHFKYQGKAQYCIGILLQLLSSSQAIHGHSFLNAILFNVMYSDWQSFTQQEVFLHTCYLISKNWKFCGLKLGPNAKYCIILLCHGIPPTTMSCFLFPQEVLFTPTSFLRSKTMECQPHHLILDQTIFIFETWVPDPEVPHL